MNMSATKYRITKKARAAADVLCDERYADCGEEDILALVRAGTVRLGQVYETCARYGYHWNGLRWRQASEPKWFKLIKREGIDR